MAWVKIDDHFDEHPKHAQAGPLGWALWLAGLAYCNRNLTDGFIPWNVARGLVNWEFVGSPDSTGQRPMWTVGVTSGHAGHDVDCQMVLDLLIDAGLWEEREGGYYVHDYPDYQPTKREILRQRKQIAQRVSAFRQKKSNGPRNVDSNAVTNADVTPAPVPVPVPEKKKNTLAHPPAARNGFDTFWAAYPRKKSKGQAERAWAKLRPDEQLQGTILSALERAKTSAEWRDREAKYLPYPGTWLNAKGWEDEIPASAPSPTSAMVDCATCGYAHSKGRPCET